jgi:hypothetical protein
MNSIDFLIIYFSCGAPFAVYYFLQNKTGSKTSLFWLSNSLVWMFWLPFALFLLFKNRRVLSDLNFLNTSSDTSESEQKIYQSQKRIEKILLESELEISIFDFRETAERYAGLTTAAQNEPDKDWGKEIFQAANNEKTELGKICLQRRNRKRLAFHQTEARQDFLQIIRQLTDSISDTEDLKRSSLEMVALLNDSAAQETLEKMFAKNMQTGKLQNVEYSEKDLWNPQEHKPLRTETISTRL